MIRSVSYPVTKLIAVKISENILERPFQRVPSSAAYPETKRVRTCKTSGKSKCSVVYIIYTYSVILLVRFRVIIYGIRHQYSLIITAHAQVYCNDSVWRIAMEDETRFAIVNCDKNTLFTSDSNNTKRFTIGVLQNYLLERRQSTDFVSLSQSSLNELLKRFYVEPRKKRVPV